MMKAYTYIGFLALIYNFYLVMLKTMLNGGKLLIDMMHYHEGFIEIVVLSVLLPIATYYIFRDTLQMIVRKRRRIKVV